MAVGKKIFEPDEIRKTIQALKDYEELFEVRFLEANGKRVSSGYFRDVEVMLDQLSRLNSSDSNVYITLNCLPCPTPFPNHRRPFPRPPVADTHHLSISMILRLSNGLGGCNHRFQ